MALPYRRLALAAFNERDPETLGPTLLACCRSSVWAAEVMAGRPYETVDGVVAAADRALEALTDAQIDEVVASHPRIGEATENEQSRREQAGTADADRKMLDALEDGNREYEKRFGHAYLVSAYGKSAEELLEQLHHRLTNDPVTERIVVREELVKINGLRLERLLRS
jgi:2-oxo-4-hydroxy-4-carboxy-5-ureidoimidazoline decarboxylase